MFSQAPKPLTELPICNIQLPKHEDFFDAAVLLEAREISRDGIKISDEYYFVLKVDDPKWGNADVFDYKKASIILKLQEDFLGIYNKISGKKICLKDLQENEDLIIKVKVENGCIQYVAKLAEIYEKVTSNMNSDQQFICFLLLSGVAFSGISYWAISSLYKAYKTNELELKKKELELKSKELDEKGKERVLNSLDKAIEALSQNTATPRFLLQHISDLGTVSLCNEDPVSKGEFPRMSDSKGEDPLQEITMHIDGVYPLKKYDFETQNLQISIGPRSAWFSTKNMLDSEKDKIRSLVDESLSLCRPLSESLQINATKTEDNRISGVIVGIGEPRPTAVSYIEFLKAEFSEQPRNKAHLLPINIPR